jgi:hypothetical protein
MKRAIAVLIFTFLVISVLPVYAQNKITAKGTATIQKNFVDIARSKALNEAQRNAVEKAAGVMITSTTNVENFQVKMDRILSESKGFINTYKIISEKRSGDSYEVVIEANVSVGKLRDKMTAINLIMERKSKPRVMLIFKDAATKDAVAEAAMVKYLMAHNFKLVDAQTLKKNSEFEQLRDSAEKKAMAGLAHRYGAEVIIFGSVEAVSNSSTISNVEMNSNKVVVTGKVVNGDTGEIVTTATETKSAPGMKGDFKVLTEETATKLTRNLVDDVLENWSKELSNTATIKLVISGLDTYSILQDFKAVLPEEVKGFKGINQRHYLKGKAEFDLEIEGDVQAVAHDVARITIKDRNIKITEISQNRVEAVLLP